VHADAERHARPPHGQLLDDLQIDRVRLTTAADLLVERQPEQPGLAQGAERLPRKALLPLVRGRLRCQLGVGQLAGERDEVGRLLGGQLAVDRHGELLGDSDGDSKGRYPRATDALRH
jgi:hypothetical protein